MPVTFASVGAGNRQVQTGTSVSSSWTHTISTSNTQTLVIVAVLVDWRGDPPINGRTLTASASYGGNLMTALNPLDGSDTGTVSIQFQQNVIYFHLVNPPTGTQTVTVTANAADNVYCITGSSVAYQGVEFFSSSFGKGFSVYGGDGYSTLGAPKDSVQVLLAESTSAITASGWTSRYSAGGTINSTTTFIALGDATGTGSTYTPTPFPATPYQLYPAELCGNVRANCMTATELLGTQETTATLTHATRVGNNLAAVLVVFQYNFGNTETVNNPTSVTYDGQAMTLLGTSGQYQTTNRFRVSVYGITGIASGATSTVTITGMTNQATGRGNSRAKDIYLMTYSNVGSFGTAVQSSGSSAVSVSGPLSAIIVHAGNFSPGPSQIIRRGVTPYTEPYYTPNGTGIYETLSDTASFTGAGVGVTLNGAPTGFFL